MYFSLESEQAEEDLDVLRRRLSRYCRPVNAPDGAVFLYRLKKMSRREALSMLQRPNQIALSIAGKRSSFRGEQ